MKKTKNQLKAIFVTNHTVTQQDFTDLIDSLKDEDTLPDRPERPELTVDQVGAFGFRATWTNAPAANQRLELVIHEEQRPDSGLVDSLFIEAGENDNEFIFLSYDLLESGQTYYLRGRAYGLGGPSEWSDYIAFELLLPDFGPVVISNVANVGPYACSVDYEVEPGATFISFRFMPEGGAEEDAVIFGYVIFDGLTSGTADFTEFQPLQPSTTYTITADQWINSQVPGVYDSNELEVTTLAE